jgi:hypothetical protein
MEMSLTFILKQKKVKMKGKRVEDISRRKGNGIRADDGRTTHQFASFLPEARCNSRHWQVFWLVPAKNTFPVAQWLIRFLLLPLKGNAELTAAGTAPDLHRCSLFIFRSDRKNQIPGRS